MNLAAGCLAALLATVIARGGFEAVTVLDTTRVDTLMVVRGVSQAVVDSLRTLEHARRAHVAEWLREARDTRVVRLDRDRAPMTWEAWSHRGLPSNGTRMHATARRPGRRWRAAFADVISCDALFDFMDPNCSCSYSTPLAYDVVLHVPAPCGEVRVLIEMGTEFVGVEDDRGLYARGHFRWAGAVIRQHLRELFPRDPAFRPPRPDSSRTGGG